jgi:hypothetical protein
MHGAWPRRNMPRPRARNTYFGGGWALRRKRLLQLLLLHLVLPELLEPGPLLADELLEFRALLGGQDVAISSCIDGQRGG